MSRNKGDIVRSLEAELRAMQAAGKTGSDWKAAARKPIPDGRDPDDAMEPIEWGTTELPMPRRKGHINLRIDADMLAFFHGQGGGYQTKINAVLRSYVGQLTMRRHEAPPNKAEAHDPGGAGEKVRAGKIASPGGAKKAEAPKKTGNVGSPHPAQRARLEHVAAIWWNRRRRRLAPAEFEAHIVALEARGANPSALSCRTKRCRSSRLQKRPGNFLTKLRSFFICS